MNALIKSSLFAMVFLATGMALPALSEERDLVSPPVPGAHVSVDGTITFYENKVRRHPTSFAAFAALGSAYLDKARDTHDSAWLAKARHATDRSLELQSNVIALTTMAAICNFSHRFACGLDYAQRAARIRPGDTSVLPMLVEAELGLGKLALAEALIERQSQNDSTRLAALAARGRWFAEQERFDEAHAAFVAAAAAARQSGADDLVIWAETNAAGMLLDSDRPGPALAHLEAASAIQTRSWPIAVVLQVHWAELHQQEGRLEAALAIYDSILARQADPEMYRRAFVIAKQLGNEPRAATLLAEGQSVAEEIRAAGEIFALEPEARLYADAGVRLELALTLAQENLRHKSDRSAHETLAEVEQRWQQSVAAFDKQ